MRSMTQLPGSPSQKADPALFRAIAEGDLGPLGVLFDRYHEDVRQFLLRAAPQADAADLVQETFLAAARAASSYDGRENARPFLIGVAAQLLRRRRRTLARLRNLVEAVGRAPEAPSTSPEQALLAHEDHALVRAAVAKLSDDRRLALVMVEFQGMSGPEAAAALEVPVGTVWRWLHEARTEVGRTLSRGKR